MKIRRLLKPKLHNSEDAPNKWKDRLVPGLFVLAIIGAIVAFAKVPALQLDKAPPGPTVKSAAAAPSVWLDDPSKQGGIGRR
jgi:hypothetical protein